MSFVSDLEPVVVFRFFDEILEIPRGSKKEGMAREYVLSVAACLGLEHQRDAVGNVVVRKPATGGGDGAATVLQAHLDMVQEKNSDVDFDFATDAIRPVRDGEYLTADGTTLGSDNGIGVATMLAVMASEDVVHGPLEFLFTVDEETGLTGASGLSEDLLEGRRLINLDSEEEGVLTIGCAGGADSHVLLGVERAAVGDAAAFQVRVSGLKGGHSGVDIHLQRGNAIKALGRALHVVALTEPVRLAGVSGGNAHNAIPREAEAVLVVPRGQVESTALDTLGRELQSIKEELAATDSGFTFEIEPCELPADAWTEASTRKVLSLLTGLPHGVMAMSPAIPGLVETSTNLAVVREDDGRAFVLMSSRSSVMSALEALRQRIRAIAWLAGADVEERDGYPAWQPNVDSELLAVVRRVHDRIAGQAEIGAVHAGLECGIIGEKYPGMDMISFGPQIDFPHSPDERVHIPSVKQFYDVLVATLEELSRT